MANFQQYQIDPDIFDNPILSLHLKCIRFCGYITATDQRFPWCHFLRVTFFTFYHLAAAIFLVYVNVSKGFENLDKYATSWATALFYVTASITFLNAYFQRKRIVDMINFVHTDLQLLRLYVDKEETQLLKKTVKYLRHATIMLYIPSTIALTLVLLECLYYTIFWPDTIFNSSKGLNTQHMLLFKLYPVREVSNSFFITRFGPRYLCLLMAAFAVPTWHTFMTCLFKYVIMKFEIISKRMQQMDTTKINNKLRNTNNTCKLKEAERDYWLFKLCEYCVNEQIKMRWYVHELQQFIAIPMLIDFITFSILICMVFYALLIGNPSLINYSFGILYLAVLSLIMWQYHWHCTLITESNNHLRFAIYSSDWYMYSVKLQKTIYLLMIESNRPLVLRAIFVELNVRTFVDIVRGAFSYLSILRNIKI